MLLENLRKKLKEKNIDLKNFELQYIIPTIEILNKKEKVVDFELKFLIKDDDI